MGVTIGGLAVHHKKASNPEIYPLKLDKNGYAVVFGGINFSVSYRINDYVGIKAVQSLIFYDSAGKFAGISHIGVQLHDDIVGLKSEEHHFSHSIGPFWYYRKNWSNIPGYTNDPSFIKMDAKGIWERKFAWYGGFSRYDYRLDAHNDLVVDFLPGYPFVYAGTVGWGRRN